MTVPPSTVLAALADDMLAYSRALRDPYLQHNAFLSHTVLAALAQEVDGQAARLVDESTAIAAILRDAVPLLPDGLSARVTAAIAPERPPSLLLSALQARNDRLRALLIDVHAAVESMPGPAAADLDARIWEEYRQSLRRRHVEPPR